ncbi:hypothetical protein PR202_ga08255 [Eleusine coracana subsp. coracana]|uniref:Uncharacterized protein n=1 Tax=Eleusine coracana subsp. coracana TaxID=191504 RepID=A0AAV5C211_ELECO|nr:hypothetical protein PR202_ga08255 [Eleusine coracana subsp. coracana]
MLLRLGQVRAVVISSPEAAREVMKTHDTVYMTMNIFTYGGQDISFAPYGSNDWKELREEEAARLVAAVVASSSPAPVNITSMIKVTMNDILMRYCAIGDTSPMRDEYIEALDKGLKIDLGRVQPERPVPWIAARTDARQRLP